MKDPYESENMNSEMKTEEKAATMFNGEEKQKLLNTQIDLTNKSLPLSNPTSQKTSVKLKYAP